MQFSERADMESITGLKSANWKQVHFQSSQSPWSAGAQAGRHCNTCKISWIYACFLWMQWKNGTREYTTAERQTGAYQWGWGEQLLLCLAGDIIYLQYSNTAHLLPTHWEPSSSSCLWDLSETHWKHSSGRDLLCHRSAFFFITSFHQLPFSPYLPLSLRLRALPSSCMSIHILNTLPQLHYTNDGIWLFIPSSHIHFHIAPFTQPSSVSIILCCCWNLSLELMHRITEW